MLQTITATLSKFCDSRSARQSLLQVTTEIISDVDAVDAQEWSRVVHNGQLFLCLDYLRALQNAHDEGLELRCVIFRKEGKIIGVAAFQITHFTTSEEAYSGWFLRSLSRVAEFFRGKHIHNILICGNAIATGEHGFAFIDEIDVSAKALMITATMKQIAMHEKTRGKPICAMVAKDFYPDSKEFPDQLTKARFKSFQVDHNMVMPLLAEWNCFDDYMQAMNTKFRTKAKSAIAKSKTMEISNASADDLEQCLDRLAVLYDNVHSRADFRLGKLDIKTLPLLVRQLPNQFKVKLYKLNGEVVGFLSAMCCGDTMEAHIIGIDYTVNKEHALYQRMLYDYVDLAIEQKCIRIVFGRTAAEIKSTVGAFPVNLTCSMLHRRIVSNALLAMILQYIKPSDYPQRDPWKAETLEKLKRVKLYQ